MKVRDRRTSKFRFCVVLREHGSVRLKESVTKAVCLFAVFLWVATNAFAQLDAADLRVIVKDANGGAI